MTRILSTYLFVKRKLNPALVADIAASGVNAVELFCARSHFDYRSADVVQGAGRRAARPQSGRARRARSGRARFRLHARQQRARSRSAIPSARGAWKRWTKSSARSTSPRTCPFPYLVQHLGSSRDPTDPRRFDAAFSSLEHLRIFAKQRGVTIALENTPGELATPANLRQFLAETRLTDLRLCFDIGHAHLGDGVLPSLETMRDLVVTAHIHDNHGLKDEHLAPYDGARSTGKQRSRELPADAAGVRTEGAAGLGRAHAGVGIARRGARSVRRDRRRARDAERREREP